MAELKSLQDFYNPTLAMSALNYQVNQQHLALQQQQVENQNKNMQIDNLRQALSVANPMESYPLVKQLMEMNGQQAPAVNEYYANPDTYRTLLTNKVGSPEHTEALQTWLKASPSSRGVVEKEMNSQLAQQGAGQFLEEAGVPNSPATRQLAVGSQAVMSQVTDAIAMNALQKEHSQRVKAANQEHQALVTRIKPEVDAIDTLSQVSARQIENIQPIIPKMQKIEAQYQKDLKSLGRDAAQKKRDTQIRINPELAKYEQARAAAKTQYQQGLDGLHQQEDALIVRLHKLHDGTDTLKEGESLELLQGQLAQLGHQIDYTKAALGVAENPSPASVKAFGEMKKRMDTRREVLRNTKIASEQGLELRKASFDATQAERVAKHDLQNRQALAESELLESVGRKENPDAAAARIGRKYNVAPSDIKKALEDPTKKGQINMNFGSPGERGKIAEEQTLVGQVNNLIKDFKPGYVGYVDEKVGRAGQMLNTLSQERQQWLARQRVLISDLRSEKYGAALTQTEIKRAEAELPNEKMGDDQWVESAKAWRDNWAKKIDNRMKMIEKGQKASLVEQRFKELEASGKSKEEIFQQLMQEGL